MSIVHSYAVGNGDMFSIRHGTDNCTVIDCSISEDNQDWILEEIDKQRKGKGVYALYFYTSGSRSFNGTRNVG